MKTITRSDLYADIEGYFDSVCATSEPLLVSCREGKKVVVVPQAEWDSIQETFYITGSSETMKSIRSGERDYIEGRYSHAGSTDELKNLAADHAKSGN